MTFYRKRCIWPTSAVSRSGVNHHCCICLSIGGSRPQVHCLQLQTLPDMHWYHKYPFLCQLTIHMIPFKLCLSCVPIPIYWGQVAHSYIQNHINLRWTLYTYVTYIYITSYHSPKSLWLPFIQLHQAIFKGHTVTQSHIFPTKTSKMEEFPIDLRLTKSDSPTNSQPFRSSGTASAKGFSSLLLLAVSLALVQPPDVGFQISTLWLFNIAMV